MFSKSKNGLCGYCKLSDLVYAVLSVLALIASIVGVYSAHFGMETGPVFGTMSGSLSILSLVACLFFARKIGGSCCYNCVVKK